MTSSKDKGIFLRRILLLVSIISAYLFVSLVITFPLVRNFTNGFASLPLDLENGDPVLTDVSYTLWTFWWFKKALFDLGTNPFFSSFVFFPWGTSLVSSVDGLLNIIISLPLQAFLNVVTAYNAVVILNFILAGLTAFFLADFFLNSRLASFFSGLYVMTSTFMILRSLQHLNLQNPAFAFLFLLFFLKFITTGRLRFYLACQTLLFLTALSSWYFFLYLPIVCLVLISAYAFETKGDRAFFVQLLKKTAGVFAPALLIFFILALSAATSGVLGIYGPPASVAWSNDLLSFISPPERSFLYSGLGRWLTPKMIRAYGGDVSTLLEKNNFIGFFGLFSLLYFIKTFRGRFRRLVILTVPLLYLFSLGPFLIILGRFIFFPLPYWLVYLVYPFLFLVRAPNRISIFVVLFLSVPVGYLAKNVISRGRNFFSKSALAFSLSVFLIAEGMIYPIEIFKIKANPFFEKLSGVGPAVILDFPLYPQGHPANKRYLFDRIFHEKRILAGPIVSANRLRNAPAPSERYPFFSCLAREKSENDFEEIRSKLKADEVNYLLIHRRYLCPEVGRSYEVLRGSFPSVYSDEEIEVLDVTNY